MWAIPAYACACRRQQVNAHCDIVVPSPSYFSILPLSSSLIRCLAIVAVVLPLVQMNLSFDWALQMCGIAVLVSMAAYFGAPDNRGEKTVSATTCSAAKQVSFDISFGLCGFRLFRLVAALAASLDSNSHTQKILLTPLETSMLNPNSS